MQTNHVTIVKKRIEYEDYYFVILPDIAAGLKRYTAYRIGSSPGAGKQGRTKVIARGCSLKICKKVVRDYPKPKRLKAVVSEAKRIAEKIKARLATVEGKAALAKAGKESRQRVKEMADRTRFDWMDR